jgi:hypothetical protein
MSAEEVIRLNSNDLALTLEATQSAGMDDPIPVLGYG